MRNSTNWTSGSIVSSITSNTSPWPTKVLLPGGIEKPVAPSLAEPAAIGTSGGAGFSLHRARARQASWADARAILGSDPGHQGLKNRAAAGAWISHRFTVSPRSSCASLVRGDELSGGAESGPGKDDRNRMKFSPNRTRRSRPFHDAEAPPDRQLFRLFRYAGTGRRRWRAISRMMSTAMCSSPPLPARRHRCCVRRWCQQCPHHPPADLPAEGRGICRGRDDRQDPDPRRHFSAQPPEPISKAKLVVGRRMLDGRRGAGRDLLSFGTPILVLGDPAQLPPIRWGFLSPSTSPTAFDRDPPPGARQSDHPAGAGRAQEGAPGKVPKKNMKGDYGTARGDRARRDVDSDLVLSVRPGAGGDQPDAAAYNQRLRELKGFGGKLPQAGATSWSACATTLSKGPH